MIFPACLVSSFLFCFSPPPFFSLPDLFLLSLLSQVVLNGRQIRTAVQLAQALAYGDKTVIDKSHLEKTLAVASQFEQDLNWEKMDFSPKFPEEPVRLNGNPVKDGKWERQKRKGAERERNNELHLFIYLLYRWKIFAKLEWGWW